MPHSTPTALLLQGSLFLHKMDNAPVPLSMPYPDTFLEESVTTDGTPKSERAADGTYIPLWCPASYTEGTTRAKHNVVEVSALVLDVDGLAETELAFTVWGEYDFVLHTTRSHTAETPSYRIILPYTRPATPGEHESTWAWGATRMGQTVDESCKDPCRMYYIPSNAPGVTPDLFRNTGKLLEPLPASGGYQKPSAPNAAVDVADFLDVVTTDLGRITFDRIEGALRSALPSGRATPMHTLSIQLGEAVAARELNPAEALDMLEAVDRLWMSTGSAASHISDATNGFMKGLAKDMGASIAGAFDKLREQRTQATAAAQDVPSAAARLVNAKDAVKAAKNGTPDARIAAQVELDAAKAAHKAATQQADRAARAAARSPLQAGALMVNGNLEPLPVVENVVRVLMLPQYADRAPWWDDFKGITMIGDAQITPADELELCCTFSASHRLHPNEGVIHRGIEASALTRRRHPVKERFEANPWDNVSRTNDLALTICGPGEDAAEDAYNARCIRQWAISAVKRIYEPGCKADSMLVLFAEAGGEGKTTALAALVGEDTGWYNTSPVSMDEKRTMMVLPYFWVHEVAEMPMRSNNEEYMNFIDRTHDSGVRMHGTAVQNIPRQCVLWGSTNRRLFLVDRSSENRRYLVLEVRHSNIDIQRIRDMSLQFWAEIYAAYRAGERSYPSPEERAETGYRNRQYLADDSIEETVAAIFGLSTKTFWTSLELRKKVLSEAPELRATDTAIGLAASKFGWTNTRNNAQRGWKWNGSTKPHAVAPKTPAPITNMPSSTAVPNKPFPSVNAK